MAPMGYSGLSQQDLNRWRVSQLVYWLFTSTILFELPNRLAVLQDIASDVPTLDLPRSKPG